MGQIPIESFDIDKLPRETGWKFEEIARIVGSLYLESSHQINTMRGQLEATFQQFKESSDVAVKRLEEKIRQLEMENLNLKRELERRDAIRTEAAATNLGKD